MHILVRYYLRVEPDRDMEKLLEQYADALWIEERQAIIMTNAVGKAMGGK